MITTNKSLIKYYSTNNLSYSSLIKKVKVLNKLLNILNNVLELNYTISFSTKEGNLLAIVSREDSTIRDNNSTLKDNDSTLKDNNSTLKNNVSTSRIDNSAPNISISTTRNDNSSTKGYNSSIRVNNCATKDNISLITNTNPLIALKPLISIRYFENYLL